MSFICEIELKWKRNHHCIVSLKQINRIQVRYVHTDLINIVFSVWIKVCREQNCLLSLVQSSKHTASLSWIKTIFRFVVNKTCLVIFNWLIHFIKVWSTRSKLDVSWQHVYAKNINERLLYVITPLTGSGRLFHIMGEVCSTSYACTLLNKNGCRICCSEMSFVKAK